MFVLVFGQAKGPGERVDHFRAGPGLPAAFEPDVVVVADAGKGGQLLAPQPRGASETVHRHADLA